MQSLTELYKAGRGPSSSHTMGPDRAARRFLAAHPEADAFLVTLYGSLAKTGQGHGTDRVLHEAFAPLPVSMVLDEKTQELPHPNTMDLTALKEGVPLDRWRVMSVGGGTIEVQGQPTATPEDIYPHSTFADIKAFCVENNLRLWEYVAQVEGEGIWDFLYDIWNAMETCIKEGLEAQGFLPGGLSIERRAHSLYHGGHMDETAATRENRLICAYAFAAGEQNASGGTVVTAPTCGACGVLPAVLQYTKQTRGVADSQVLRALATGGLIGNLIKTNASISGAECGCQAEIGSACSMAAAALAEFYDMTLDQIEYSAEIAMEHHLGLTCDPIRGLVQIPCIERNAVAAMRALNAVRLANFLTNSRKISFDMVVETMYQTGLDMSHQYKETSEGGLARLYETP